MRKKKKKKKRKREEDEESNSNAVKKTQKSSDDGMIAARSAKVEEWQALHKVTVDDKAFVPCMTWSESTAFVGKAFTEYCAKTKKWEAPTPIQAQCWPILATGRDAVAIAETGSGKTLGFAAPALLRLSKETDTSNKKLGGKNIPTRFVALCPTRELAQQSFEVVGEFATIFQVACGVAYGGINKRDQRAAIGACAVLIATPGRLDDLVQSKELDLSAVDFLVLDEADRMLDMGFLQVVRGLAAACQPCEKRITCMFSATWPAEVRKAAHDFMRNDFVFITVGQNERSRDTEDGSGDNPVANARVVQTVIVLEERQRDSRLLNVLEQHFPTDAEYRRHKVIVFGLYKKECARLERFLNDRGWDCAAIHGDMSQANRTKSFDAFKSGQVPLLVATDVAARGLDIPDVSLVINYSFPLTVEDLVHRVGRTGRAGKKGKAVTFFHGGAHEKALAGAFQNVLRQANQPVPSALLAFGSTVKKKEHKLYGAFGPKSGSASDGAPMKKPTKITFD
uniref:RNA helicase n=1 Tax=Aureoumbra lagunensis TaxID=44058 RepID=A0A6S8CGM2_9STRA